MHPSGYNMRVIAELGGRGGCSSPRGEATRPTSERCVREALFSMLGEARRPARARPVRRIRRARAGGAVTRRRDRHLRRALPPRALSPRCAPTSPRSASARAPASSTATALSRTALRPGKYDLCLPRPTIRGGGVAPRAPRARAPRRARRRRPHRQRVRPGVRRFELARLPLRRERRYGDTMIKDPREQRDMTSSRHRIAVVPGTYDPDHQRSTSTSSPARRRSSTTSSSRSSRTRCASRSRCSGSRNGSSSSRSRAGHLPTVRTRCRSTRFRRRLPPAGSARPRWSRGCGRSRISSTSSR